MATNTTAAKKPAVKKSAPRKTAAKKAVPRLEAEHLPPNNHSFDSVADSTVDDDPTVENEPTVAKVNPHVTALKPNGAWWEGLSNTPNRAKLSR